MVVLASDAFWPTPTFARTAYARLVPYRMISGRRNSASTLCRPTTRRGWQRRLWDRRGDRAIALAHLEWKSPKNAAASTASARLCINSRTSRVAKVRRALVESCGPRCRRWTVISAAESLADQLRRNASVPDCELEPRSPKGQPISQNRRMNKSQQMRWKCGAASISCCRFVAPSTMARSVPPMGRSSNQLTIHPHQKLNAA